MEDTNTLIKQAETEGITLWSEDKKKEFVELFKQRSKASQYVLVVCANRIEIIAKNRRYISDKHTRELEGPSVYNLVDKKDDYYSPSTIGGRSADELTKIAEERARAILEELPPLKTAVQIIDKDTAKKIDERDALLKKAKAVKEQLEAISDVIAMAEVDQSMTVGEFRKMVKDRERKRKALATKLNDIGKEGTELDETINKRLYAGLPGLSDAVIKVVREHHERAIALAEVTRRIEERVLFGDSQAALEMLKGFEKDEVIVSDSIKAEFRKALERLQVAGKRKQIKGRKK